MIKIIIVIAIAIAFFIVIIIVTLLAIEIHVIGFTLIRRISESMREKAENWYA